MAGSVVIIRTQLRNLTTGENPYFCSLFSSGLKLTLFLISGDFGMFLSFITHMKAEAEVCLSSIKLFCLLRYYRGGMWTFFWSIQAICTMAMELLTDILRVMLMDMKYKARFLCNTF